MAPLPAITVQHTGIHQNQHQPLHGPESSSWSQQIWQANTPPIRSSRANSVLSAAPVHDSQLVVRQHCSARTPLIIKHFLCRFGTWSSCTATTSPRCCSCTRCAALPWRHRLSLPDIVQCWLTPQVPDGVQFTSFNDQEHKHCGPTLLLAAVCHRFAGRRAGAGPLGRRTDMSGTAR